MRITSKKVLITIRIALILLYLGLGVLMFMLGRTHTILLDNKDAKDGSYKAFSLLEAQFKGNEDVKELFPKDRVKTTVTGQHHTIILKFSDGREDFKSNITIPIFQDAILISLPALVEGKPNAITNFDLYGDN